MSAMLLAGVVAGGAHVVSGPDHLAAVLPLTTRTRRPALEAGAAWGLGHGLGVLLLIGVGQGLRGVVDIASVGGLAELAVGVLLVLVGWRTVQQAGRVLADPGPRERRGVRNAVGFGLLHGVAGTAHLLAALPGVVADPWPSVIYGAAYVGGAILTMALFAGVVGRVLVRMGRIDSVLRWTGVAAIAVGVVWILIALT